MTTLTNLILQSRERADQVGSEFVSDAELTRIINLKAKEFRDILISSGEDYFVTESSSFTIASNGVKAVETDFYKLLGVDLSLGGRWVPMRSYTWQERNRDTIGLGTRTSEIEYRLVGTNIRFTPASLASGQTARYWYVPKFTELSGGSDDLPDHNGWDEYVVISAAIVMKDKEESDVSVLMAEKMAIKQRIEEMKQNRDQGEPQRVQDVRRDLYINEWEY